MTLDFFFQNAWLWANDLPEKQWAIDTDNIEQTEWSAEFETLMRHRLVMGALRYGKINGTNKPEYNRIVAIHKRMWEFVRSGNKELLVDIANFCLLEFVETKHPAAHFQATDGGEHVSLTSASKVRTQNDFISYC